MIKNVIFDIGGVLLHYDYEKIYKRFSKNLLDWYFLYKEVVMSPEWLGASLIDYGYLTVEEAIAQIQDRTGHSHDELVENFLLHCHEDRPVAKAVVYRMKQLKEKGYRIFILSNTGVKMAERLKTASNVFDMVDGYILSNEVHQVKPYPSIFQSLLTKYGLNPDECIFIDDNSKNVKTAERLGLHAFKVDANSEQSVLKVVDSL